MLSDHPICRRHGRYHHDLHPRRDPLLLFDIREMDTSRSSAADILEAPVVVAEGSRHRVATFDPGEDDRWWLDRCRRSVPAIVRFA